MTMFVSLADLAELHGVKSRKLLSSTAANTDEAVKQAVTSGNMDFYRQVLADWAKSAVLYRHTAATPAEIAKNFAKPDFQAFANELFARVKGGGPVNSAGAGAPPSGGPAIPWQNFEVLDPNTPGTTVPGETFTVTETTPDPVASPTQSAPPPPAYTPPPAYVPPPVVAPSGPASQPTQQPYFPPTPVGRPTSSGGGMIPPGADPWGDAVPAPSKPSSSAPSAAPSTALVPGISNTVLIATGLGGLLLLGAIVMTRRGRSRDDDRRDRDNRDRDINRDRDDRGPDMRQNKKRRGKGRRR